MNFHIEWTSGDGADHKFEINTTYWADVIILSVIIATVLWLVF